MFKSEDFNGDEQLTHVALRAVETVELALANWNLYPLTSEQRDLIRTMLIDISPSVAQEIKTGGDQGETIGEFTFYYNALIACDLCYKVEQPAKYRTVGFRA